MTSAFVCSQGGVFRGGPGPGEVDRPDVCGEVHPEEGSEGEGEQHRERDRRAEEVSDVAREHTQISLLIPGYPGNCISHPTEPPWSRSTACLAQCLQTMTETCVCVCV